MVFYVNRLDGNGNSVPIVVGLKNTNTNDVFGIETIVHEAGAIQQFTSEAEMQLAVLDSSNKLFIVLANVIDSGECQDVTVVYNLITKVQQSLNTKELPDAYNKKITNKLLQCGMQEANAHCAVYFVMDYIEYLASTEEDTMPTNIGPAMFSPTYFGATQARVSSLNIKESWPFTELTTEENVTLYQNSPEDPLFIKLPNRNLLMDENVQLKDFLPAKKDLCSPYGAYELEDMSEYKTDSRFPASLYEDVEGRGSNNTFELYPNEEKFYKALIEWIQFNMKSTALGDIDVSPSSPNIDKISQIYLEELAKLLYVKHWYHNLNVPIFAPEDEDDMEDLIRDTEISDYQFRMNAIEKDMVSAGITSFSSSGANRSNALEDLVSYLRDASLSVGYVAYVQAIIQLARWGKRKPTSIVIDRYSLIFSLGDNKVKTYMGNISNYKLQQVDGCDVEAKCAFYEPAEFKDREYLKNHNFGTRTITAPVGLCTGKMLINTTKQGPDKIMSYENFSLVDLVHSYMTNGAIKVAGIKYEDGVFTTTKDIPMDTKNTYFSLKESIKEEDNLEDPFPISDEWENLFMYYEIAAKKPVNHFDLINVFAMTEDLDIMIERNQFRSKEELLNKIKDRICRSKLSAFNFTYGSVLIPIYLRVSLWLNEIASEREVTFADVLNAYKTALETSDYADRIDYKKVEASGTDEKQASSTDTNKMNLFGAASEPAEQVATTVTAEEKSSTDAATGTEATKTQTTAVKNDDKFSFIKPADKKLEFCELLDKNGNLVGGFARELFIKNTSKGPARKVRIILVTKDELAQIPPEKIKKKEQIRAIIFRLAFDIFAYETGQKENIALFFSSMESLQYYTRLFSDLHRGDAL